MSNILPAFRHYVRNENRWMILLLGLVLGYVIVVPSLSLVPPLGPYNEKRALQIGVLLTVGCVLVASSTRRRRWLFTFTNLPRLARLGLAVVLGLGLLSSALAPAPFYAYLEVAHFLLLFAAAGIVATLVQRDSDPLKWVLLGGVVLSCLLSATYFTSKYAAFVFFPELEVGRETVSGFANVRFFNQYQTWTLPLLGGAVLALPRERRGAQAAVFGLTALWWTLVLASNVRGTVTAMAIAALGAALLFRRGSQRWLFVQGAAFLAGGGLYYVLFYLTGDAAPQVVERLANTSAESRRLQRWTKSLRMAFADPWLGIGPMHYSWAPYNFAKPAHPHSALMQWLAEWGVPSTMIMGGLTLWGGFGWMKREQAVIRTERDSNPPMAVALVAAVLAGAAHAMVSGLLVMPLSQVLFVLIGGWAWGRYQRAERNHSPSNESHHSGQSHVVLCVVLVASMAVVGTSLRNLATIEERRSAFFEKVDRDVLSPRYWTQGYIGVSDSSATVQSVQDHY